MPRDFNINFDPSWYSGSIGAVSVPRPIINLTNTVASLKNTLNPYKLELGDVQEPSNKNPSDKKTINN